MRRQQLTEAQIATLFDPLTDQRELLRHYTLTETDIAMIGGAGAITAASATR